jgi:hypothetical protein
MMTVGIGGMPVYGAFFPAVASPDAWYAIPLWPLTLGALYGVSSSSGVDTKIGKVEMPPKLAIVWVGNVLGLVLWIGFACLTCAVYLYMRPLVTDELAGRWSPAHPAGALTVRA